MLRAPVGAVPPQAHQLLCYLFLRRFSWYCFLVIFVTPAGLL
jgi:hypothetical protein